MEMGRIDNGSELFGNMTPQTPGPGRNGFRALAEYDKPEKAGNEDGQIDARDRIFSSLRLWNDANHNGQTDPGELVRLTDVGLESISLEYKESRRVDQFGNQFRYRARVEDSARTNIGR
jgi:hypothetical protein